MAICQGILSSNSFLRGKEAFSFIIWQICACDADCMPPPPPRVEVRLSLELPKASQLVP